MESEEDDDFATLAAAKRHKPGSGKVSFLQISESRKSVLSSERDSSQVVARVEYELFQHLEPLNSKLEGLGRDIFPCSLRHC